VSVTFDVERDRSTFVPPPACTGCGAQSGVKYGDPSCEVIEAGDHVPCGGYGPSVPETGLNVANANAGVILFDLLGYGRAEKDYACGDLDPADVLRRLSLADDKAAQCARPASQSRGVYMDANGVGDGCLVIEGALTTDRVGQYVDKLREMATEALAAGRQITYG
jgi:hypothetical protein